MIEVTAARQAWQEGSRRFDLEARDPRLAESLHEQRDAVLEELRRRLGPTFTLAELAAAYESAERWLRQVLEERALGGGWVRTVSLAGDAAFHVFSREAQDYVP